MKNIKISNCDSCPFSGANDMSSGFHCTIGGKGRIIKDDKNYRPDTPDWCPIKKEPVTIEFNKLFVYGRVKKIKWNF